MRVGPQVLSSTTVGVQDNKGKSVEELLAEANALLDQVSHGEYAGLQASIDELEDLGYTCDESGCVLILPEKPKRAQGACTGTTLAHSSISAAASNQRCDQQLHGSPRDMSAAVFAYTHNQPPTPHQPG